MEYVVWVLCLSRHVGRWVSGGGENGGGGGMTGLGYSGGKGGRFLEMYEYAYAFRVMDG